MCLNLPSEEKSISTGSLFHTLITRSLKNIVRIFCVIQMLVVFKSAPILKRALKVKHAMIQLFILKLLKMQTKYLGRQWRKSNMKTMSAIYQKVRHRLTDDWAYGNGLYSCVRVLLLLVVVVVVVIAQQVVSYRQLSRLRKSATVAGLTHRCIGVRANFF